MKTNKVVLIVLLCFCFVVGYSQTNADDIIGTWLTKDGKGKVSIEKGDGKYAGKLIWVKEKKDEAKINTVILRDFLYTDNSYTKGVIYEPNHGHEATGTLTISKDGKVLAVTGKAFFGLFSQTEYWIKIK